MRTTETEKGSLLAAWAGPTTTREPRPAPQPAPAHVAYMPHRCQGRRGRCLAVGNAVHHLGDGRRLCSPCIIEAGLPRTRLRRALDLLAWPHG